MHKSLEVVSPRECKYTFCTKVFLESLEKNLIEEDYDDIEKEKFTINSSKGWLGITDKYWLTAIVPEKGKEFKAEFVAKKEKYRANYIIKEAVHS